MAKYLLLAYLWEGVAAKAVWGKNPSVWRLHMVFSILIPWVFLIQALLEHRGRHTVTLTRRNKLFDMVLWIGLLLSIWAFPVSLFQTKVSLNLLYSLGFMGMIVYTCLISPMVWRREEFDQFLDAATLPMCLNVLACVVWPNMSAGGRFYGMFYTVAQAAWTASFCAIVCFHRLGNSMGWRRAFWAGCLMVGTTVTIMTRTRGDIFALVVALASMAGARVARRSARPILLYCVSAFGVLAVLACLQCNKPQKDAILHYLRLSEDQGERLDTRSKNWAEGIESIAAHPVWGSGWLSRWGESTSTERGEYTFDDDPHNFLITVGKSLGVAGALAGGLLVGTLFYIVIRSSSVPAGLCARDRAFLRAICLWMLISAGFSNILISFGATTDRYCWVILSILFSERTTPTGWRCGQNKTPSVSEVVKHFETVPFGN